MTQLVTYQRGDPLRVITQGFTGLRKAFKSTMSKDSREAMLLEKQL